MTSSKPSKVIQAVRLLMSWFDAAGVQWEKSRDPGVNLLVLTQTSQILRVSVVDRIEDGVPEGDVVVMLAGQLYDRDPEIALGAFHIVTELAGYGRPVPVNRGKAPMKNGKYQRRARQADDFDLVAMRHCEFRRVPNPPAEKLKRYERVVSALCKYAARRNQMLFGRHGIFEEDLRSYAMVWTTTFIGLFERADISVDANQKLLNVHLRQRFVEFVKLLQQKERNVLPEFETASVALNGAHDVVGYGTAVQDLMANAEGEVDAGYLQRHCQIDTSDELKRRKSAGKLLTKLLGELPHDILVSKLEEVIAAPQHSPDARIEAVRRLEAHKEECSACVAIRGQVQEEVRAGDRAS